jgi:alkanesulfonate monooxygenase SsuD/methylene tetrahydromethanopterin reductase-like flavin-dependent oxidoreductase (luciferase family)
MRIGSVILPDRSWSLASALWRRADELGFAHGWTYDHLVFGPLRDSTWFGAFPTLTAAATVTSRMRLGVLVASPNFRHPVSLAREALTVDDVSGGRLELGIGAGSQGDDATVFGRSPWRLAERSARFAEFVYLTDRLLRERGVSHAGRYYSAHEARAHPGCVQRPRVPIVLAAAGTKGMAVVARFGDAWVTYGPPEAAQLDPVHGANAVAEQRARLEDACVAVGRDPSGVRRVVVLGPVLRQGTTSADEFADTVGRYAAAGMTEVLVHWPRETDPYRGDRDRFESAVGAQLAAHA